MGGEKGTHLFGIMWVACSQGPETLAWSLQGSSHGHHQMFLWGSLAHRGFALSFRGHGPSDGFRG